MAKTITIRSGNPLTGRLELSDGGRTEAESLEVITWDIREGSNVFSFRIEDKSGTRNVFNPARQPPRNHIKVGSATVADRQDGRTYNYNIFWRESEGGPEKRHDPIIAIRPSRPILTWVLIPIAAVVFVLSYFVYWRMMRMRKNKDMK